MTGSPIVVGADSQYTTIQEGISAAEQAGVSMVLIEAGTYTENDTVSNASGLTLSASGQVTLNGSIAITDSSGITISGISFQGDGTNIAVTATNSTNVTVSNNSFTGIGQAVRLIGTTDSTVSANAITNAMSTTAGAIEIQDGSDNVTVDSNVIDGDAAQNTIGAIYLHGSSDSSITHNQITNASGAGISLSDFDGPGTTATENTNDTIAYNSLDDVVTSANDSGAIYILGRSQDPQTNITITDNYIGTAGSAATAQAFSSNYHVVGVYLDDNASGVSVTGNVLQAGQGMTDPYEIHGGSNDTISGNIFDLGAASTIDFGLFQSDAADQQPVAPFQQLTNDVVTGNIFASESTAPHDPGFGNLTGGIGSISILRNDFYNYAGGSLEVAGAGPAGDSNPFYQSPATMDAQSLADYADWTSSDIDFTPIDTSLIGPVDSTACYCPDTRIMTPHGEVAIEALRIGDEVLTASGARRPIRWIGERRYVARFARRNRELWPVLIRAGALADGVPGRDLSVSPLHAMFLDGLLVPADALVNGVSIVQSEPAGEIAYLHLELDSHDVILAEGAPSESFVDDDSREMFHNATSYAALYPHAIRQPAEYCAPRVTGGFTLEPIRRRIAARAGLGEAAASLPLRGFLDLVRSRLVEGWAQNPDHPEVPVCLDVMVGRVTVAQILANRYRGDLAQAGLGSGHHAFSAQLPVTLTPEQLRLLAVRRSSDHATLPRSHAALHAA